MKRNVYYKLQYNDVNKAFVYSRPHNNVVVLTIGPESDKFVECEWSICVPIKIIAIDYMDAHSVGIGNELNFI